MTLAHELGHGVHQFWLAGRGCSKPNPYDRRDGLDLRLDVVFTD